MRSGIRVIYAFFPDTRKVVFIEMYFKGDKESEDRRRIQGFFQIVSRQPMVIKGRGYSG